MRASYTQRGCFFLTVFLLSMVYLDVATASVTMNVYGAEQVETLKDCRQDICEYNLYMGSFKNKQYAIDYRERLSRQTKSIVHLDYKEGASIPYTVYLGTFSSLRALKQVSEVLLGHATTLEPTPLSVALSPTSTWIMALSVGPVWERAGKTQTFYLTPDIEKTFAANHASQALVDGELFLGIQKSLCDKLEGQIGLAVATTGNAALSGNIWEDADVQFNNAKYSYTIKHTHLAVKGKLLSERGYIATPWFSGSVGVGFNQAHSFSNTATQAGAIAMPNFASNTTTAFTYTVGAGVQRDVGEHWQAGMGYEFADWGKSHLNRASYQILSTGLSLNHLYTNGLLLNLTYHA